MHGLVGLRGEAVSNGKDAWKPLPSLRRWKPGRRKADLSEQRDVVMSLDRVRLYAVCGMS